MIISPPFLPKQAPASTDAYEDDPVMAAIENLEQLHGIYPIAFDRRTHCGIHLMAALQNEPVRAIADGEVVAYRVSDQAIFDAPKAKEANSNNGFVLLKHTAETGEGRTLTFYSLYMHLLHLRTSPQSSASRRVIKRMLAICTNASDEAVVIS